MNSLFTSLGLGGATSIPMFAAELLTGTHIPVETAVSVAIFVAGLVWMLGRRLQKIEDKLDQLGDKVGGLPCQGPHRPPRRGVCDEKS